MTQISIRAARLNAGLTLEDVSKQTNISAYTLGKYEKGESMPKWDVFVNLCRIYNVPVTDIFIPTSSS